MNDRMLRAVLGAIDMGGGTLENFVLPVYWYAGPDHALADDGAEYPCGWLSAGLGEQIPVEMAHDGFYDVDVCLMGSVGPKELLPPDPEGFRYPFHNRWRGGVRRNEVVLCPGGSCSPASAPLLAFPLTVDATCREFEEQFQDRLGSHPASGMPNEARLQLGSPCAARPDTYFGIDSILASDNRAWQTVSSDGTARDFRLHPTEQLLNEQGEQLVGGRTDWSQYDLPFVFGLDRPELDYLIGPDNPTFATGNPRWVANRNLLDGLSFAHDQVPGATERNGFLATALVNGGFRTDLMGVKEAALPDSGLYLHPDGARGIPFADMPRNPRIGRVPILAPYRRSPQALLDGLELLCALAERDSACGSEPPIVTSLDDVYLAEGFLKCLADDVERQAAIMVLADVPKPVVDTVLNLRGGLAAPPSLRGSYGQGMQRLLASLGDLSDSVAVLAGVVRGLAVDVGSLKTSLRRVELLGDRARVQRELAHVQQALRISREIREAVADAGSALAAAFAGRGGSTYDGPRPSVSWENEVYDSVLDVELALSEVEEAGAFDDFNKAASDRFRDMRDRALAINSSLRELPAAVAALQALRAEARRHFYRAMTLDSETMQAQYDATLFMRTRLNTARVRYERALKNARRMAFLARRAVEQRLGGDLSLMSDDLPLVEAPSTWVDSVCATSGANLADYEDQLGENFADAYIGDYVTRLENVVESYRLINNFHEGEDTAVISLRDDVKNVREPCRTPVDNLLYHSGTLDSGSWVAMGCPEPPDTSNGDIGGVSCVSATRLGATVAGTTPGEEAPGSPFPEDVPNYGKAPGYRITFGDGAAGDGSCDDLSASETCYLGPEVRLSQSLDLDAGRYRLSWFGHPVAYTAGPNAGVDQLPPEDAVKVYIDGTLWNDEVAELGSGDWPRCFFAFDVPDAANVEVAIAGAGSSSQQVDIAGLMLEDISAYGPHGARFQLDGHHDLAVTQALHGYLRHARGASPGVRGQRWQRVPQVVAATLHEVV